MSKGTAIFIAILSAIAFLLIGINIGKGLRVNDEIQLPKPNPPEIRPTETPIPSPTLIYIENTLVTPITSDKTPHTYIDADCAMTYSYPGTYIKTLPTNERSTIFADSNDPDTVIATSCMKKLPRPPVSSENIEAISVDGIAATLYHDKTQSGSPRDEIIVKHPTTGLEIIVAAPPDVLQNLLPSLQFMR